METWLQVLLCVLAADFVTGLVHWWEDTYGLPTWPVIGPLIIEPNIQHHEDPTLFVRMSSLCLRNYQPLVAATVALLSVWLAGCLVWQFVLVVGLATCGNEVHGWAHSRPRHFLPRLMQEMCLVQTPQHHARHHRRPYDSHFCSLTNLVNPLLDRLRLWRGLEFLLSSVGVAPKRLSPARRGV